MALKMETGALKMETGFTAILVAILVTGGSAQSSCKTVLISLSPCLDYVTGNTTTPSSTCCSQLSSVVRSQPRCLCAVLNGGAAQLGIPLNETQALALPAACNVQTPPASRCKDATSPAEAPTRTSDSPATSGNGSKTTPATGNNSATGSSTTLQFSLLVFLVFIASFAST